MIKWNPIETAPLNKWVLVKSLIEHEPFSEDFILENDEYNFYVYVAIHNADWKGWQVNINSCGCCPREIKPFEWAELND